jgi:hypothetical protein
MYLISSSQQSTDDVLGCLTLFNGAKPFSSSSFDSNPSECVDNLAIVVNRLTMPQAIADPAFAGVTDAFLDVSELRSVTLYHRYQVVDFEYSSSQVGPSCPVLEVRGIGNLEEPLRKRGII